MVNFLGHSAIIFLIVGQEFFSSNDGYFPDVAFSFLQISLVFFEGKHGNGIKSGHNTEHHDRLVALNARSEGYGVTVNSEAF